MVVRLYLEDTIENCATEVINYYCSQKIVELPELVIDNNYLLWFVFCGVQVEAYGCWCFIVF